MRPYCENNCSNSFWVMVLGRPLTYKFASRMEAELGRAYDTYGEKRRGVLVSYSHPGHSAQTMFPSFTRHNPAVQTGPVLPNQQSQERLEEQRKSCRDLKTDTRVLKCSDKPHCSEVD